MIIIDEKGKIKLWVCEDFHINPFNSLSEIIGEAKT